MNHTQYFGAGMAFMLVLAFVFRKIRSWSRRDSFGKRPERPDVAMSCDLIRVSGLSPAVYDRVKQVAVHEAGHAVMAWLCASTDRIDRIYISRSVRTPGMVGGYTSYRTKLHKPSVGCDNLLIHMAGLAAEIDFYGVAEVRGSSEDISTTKAVAEGLLKIWPDTGGLDPRNPWPADELSPDSLPFELLFKEPVTPAVLDLMDFAYRRAGFLLAGEKERLNKLAEALRDNGMLGRGAISSILGPARTDAMETALAVLSALDAVGKTMRHPK